MKSPEVSRSAFARLQDGADAGLQPLPFIGAFDGQDEAVVVDGFDEIVVGPELGGADRLARIVNGRQHDELGLGVGRCGGFENREAIHLRHHDVQKHDIVPVFPEQMKGVPAVFAKVAIIQVPPPQNALQRLQGNRFVVHDQNFHESSLS